MTHSFPTRRSSDLPVRPNIAFAAIVDRLLFAQPVKIQADRVLLKKTRPCDINFVDRNGCNFSGSIQLHRVDAHVSSSIPGKQTHLAIKQVDVSQGMVNKAYKDCCDI